MTRRDLIRMLCAVLVAPANGFAAAKRFAAPPELIEDPDDVWSLGVKYWEEAVERVRVQRLDVNMVEAAHFMEQAHWEEQQRRKSQTGETP